MFAHPATQANLETLRRRGVTVVGPAEGHLASGMLGVGRMLEPTELLGHIRLALGRGGALHGCKIVVTAGGTQEAIDPVRVITNRSSGKQGFALAQAALDMGAEVCLIAASNGLPAPVGASRVDVRSVQEMLDAVLAAIPQADALIMAAAPADFRPAAPAGRKLKKAAGIPEIKLEFAPDILGVVAAKKAEQGRPRVVVGFAAESQDLLENARSKLEAKRLDIIAANDVSATDAGFGVDTNRVTLLYAGGRVEPLPLMTKAQVAEAVLERVAGLLGEQKG
jgi:phosphopantothenoylcysteine decarboxylase/phosphopantothenate--cysteine ligase